MNLQKILKYVNDRDYRFMINSHLGLYDKLSDERYLKKLYYLKTGEKLNLDKPQTYNEKLQWLKIHDHRPEYTQMVDKYQVRQHIAEVIGEEYLIPLLGVWEDPEEIDFESLPDQFVLKCNHNSGLGMCICKDKSSLDFKTVKKELRKGLAQDYYKSGREWPYKNVPRKIVCEKYLTDESGTELKDYKIFNFNGEPKLIQVDFDRFINHKRNLYTVDWEYIDAQIEFPTDPKRMIKKPQKLSELLELACKLSAGYPHVRTDFYCIGEKIYFGELTFYHGSGFEKFSPQSLGIEMGNWLCLPDYHK